MDALELFLRDHAMTHSAEMAKGDLNFDDRIFKGLEDAQARARPHGLNSIAWIFWHIARYEDVAVNVVVANVPQVLDGDGWIERLGIVRRDIGTAMTPEGVQALSEEIDLTALRGYRVAVGRRTREVAQGLSTAAWDVIADTANIDRAIEQGAFIEGALWVPRLWTGKANAWFFHWLAAGHSYMHIGQARWVRKLVTGKGLG